MAAQRRRHRVLGGYRDVVPAEPQAEVPDEVVRILAAVPSASLLVSADGALIRVSARAIAMGLVRRDAISVPELIDEVRQVFSDGRTRERELTVRRPPLGRGTIEMRVKAALLSPEVVVVLVDDLSEERRVDAVRRDFVANVSHELKTPVGALSLLAEATMSAVDDPAAIRHFATRIQVEASRLGLLVNDLIDLSRLQSDEPLHHAQLVRIDDLVRDAVEDVRTLAEAKSIEIEFGEITEAEVFGDRGQLVMALRNLLTNAISYSDPHTRVAVAGRESGGIVAIDVKDQGVGIPAADLDRIFERFYRIDPARSRATGGTGLGLAIVKHVCRNHGGECRVWSEVGVGSTFSLMLPAQPTTPDDESDVDGQAELVDGGVSP